MADTFTLNYAFTKPEPGTSGWDAKLNADLDAIDAQLAELVGKQTIWIPAAAMLATVSNGCSALTRVELTPGNPNLHVLDFDQAASEYAQFQIAFPTAWNEGTVTYQVFWAGAALTGNVIWSMQGVAVADDGPLDAAYGAAVTVTDGAGSAANDLMVSVESGAITIAGAPAPGKECFFRLGRLAADVGDTYASDARLLGIKIFFSVDTGNDG